MPAPVPTQTPYEGELIADYALQYDGYKYNYGGEDPETGFDCSGFVYYVFKHFGYRLNRVAEDQARNGEPVEEIEDLLPGDVICFSWITSNYINHVGIYIGDGKFIHAMDSANDVLITSLEEYLETHRWKGRRIIGAMEKKTAARIEAEERQDAEALALMMAEQERLEKEKLEAEHEANRIADLRERCAKRGLDFETENAKYLRKQAEKRAKAEAKAARKAK